MKKLFSRIVGLSRRRRLSRQEFSSEALRVLSEMYPGLDIRPTGDPEVLQHGDVQLGLQNLYSVYERSDLSRRELAQLVEEHFSRVFSQTQRLSDLAPRTWSNAQGLLRPQLMPAEYPEQTPVPFRRFIPGVHQAAVIDDQDGYAYVRHEDLESWGKTFDEVLDLALQNLDRATTDLAMHLLPPPNRMIGVEAKDGYDAARLLLPNFRRFAGQRLDQPFLAAIPNRDFLIMWSTDAPQAFQGFTRDKVRRDFKSQPYALSPLILSVTAEVIEVVQES